MPKTWKQKLEAKKAPKLQTLEKPFAGIPAGATLFVATPQLVKEFMDTIPPGQSVSLTDLRRRFARTHHGDATCPVSTAIFARVVAEAAWEEIQSGTDPAEVTPFWRVIEPGSSLAQKLACGPGFLEQMRRQEGIA
ncbi:MAG: hypothetical protein SFU83_14020 [Meiothermus sp.]|nr:hypothetical protein [Meiothermus sp.]